MNAEENKRVAHNTMFLYMRTFVVMIIALYTSRKILEILGVTDFGIMNVVGGVLTLLNFMSSSMSAATMRFLTFELGCRDLKAYNNVFNIALSIHCALSILLIILAETVGLWFVNTHLNIPTERLAAANWVYQGTIFCCAIGIMRSVYDASIIAHEHIHFTAIMGVLEAIGKLLIVFMLVILPFDRLITWSIFFLLLQVLAVGVTITYCYKSFEECNFRHYWDKRLARSMISFSGWNLFGSTASLCKGQGINIVLNIFGGAVINAAAGVAMQVNGAINSLTNGFLGAITPQLTKNYASGNQNESNRLLCESSKISYFLLFFVAMPAMLEIDFVLNVWLVEVPAYATLFARFILFESLIATLGSPIVTMLLATGNIKWFQIVVGGIILLTVPLSYLWLKAGGGILGPYAISASIFVLAFLARMVFAKRLLNLPILVMIKKIILPVFFVSIMASVLPLVCHTTMEQGWLRLFVTVGVSVVSVAVSVYFIGLSTNERLFIEKILLTRIRQYSSFYHLHK